MSREGYLCVCVRRVISRGTLGRTAGPRVGNPFGTREHDWKLCVCVCLERMGGSGVLFSVRRCSPPVRRYDASDTAHPLVPTGRSTHTHTRHNFFNATQKKIYFLLYYFQEEENVSTGGLTPLGLKCYSLSARCLFPSGVRKIFRSEQTNADKRCFF